MPSALSIDSEVVVEAPVSQADLGHTHRFTVKSGMKYWVDVDYANPVRAKICLASGNFDTDDQATYDILKLAPEFEDGGSL